jgi:Spy/CpxP family protein refolding chaperone
MAADAASAPPAMLRHHAPIHTSASVIEDRVQTMAKALDLDAKQSSRLREVLLAQRSEVESLVHRAVMEPSARIVALRMINDQTADRIRALLNEEQRKKYNPVRPVEPQGSPRPDVTALMSAMTPRVATPSASAAAR